MKIGITGSIGSGKSIVAKVFATLGIPVYNSDERAKMFLLDDGVKKQIYLKVSKNVFDEDNEIERKKLSAVVFNSKTKLDALNKIIHPLVLLDFLKWYKKQKKSSYVIYESALIFETNWEKYFDKIITVSAPIKLCIDRVMKRDGVNSGNVKKRMNNQLSSKIKETKADYVIVNDEKDMLLPQVLEIHEKQV